jgi:hypothetical protein
MAPCLALAARSGHLGGPRLAVDAGASHHAPVESDPLDDVVTAIRSHIREMQATAPDGSIIPFVPSDVSETEVATRFVRGLGPALTGFRRKGRTWTRTRDGITSGVHVYRLKASYQTCCQLRLEPFVRLELDDTVQVMPGGAMPLRAALPEWRLFNGGESYLGPLHDTSNEPMPPSHGIDAAIVEAHSCIEQDILPWLDAVSTRSGFVQRVSHNLGWRIRTQVAFEQLPDLTATLEEGPPEWGPEAYQRNFNLLDSEAAVLGYSALNTFPSPQWRTFLERTVKSFRGRPAKDVRAKHDYVQAYLTSLPTSLGNIE